MSKLKVALIFLFASLSALASAQPWHGNTYQEVESLADVPTLIKKKLGVSEPGLAGVADKGQPFNVTDVVVSSLPRRRFLVAAREGDTWLIALEHGGRGYYVKAYLFSGNGDLRKHWVLPGRPKTLQSVLDQVPVEQPRNER